MRTSHAVILVLGAALAAGTLVLTGSRPDEAAIPPDIELEARPERSRAPTLATPPPPPRIERDSHEWRLLLALSVNNSKQREWALEQILTAGTAHPQVLEALEALLEREDVRPSILCPTMHAVMLLKGNRDHVRRMAELGSSSPFGTCATHLAALDPSSGAFIARAAWLAARGTDDPKPPPAVVRAAGQWFELALVDPVAARHAVLERLASAPHAERAWLVSLALALRPLPSEVPGYVKSLLEAGTPAEQVRALGHLRPQAVAHEDAVVSLADVVAAALPRLRVEESHHALYALRVLGIATPTVVDGALAAVRHPGLTKRALETLEVLSEQVPDLAPRLVDLEAELTDKQRLLLVKTLVKLHDQRTFGYVLGRLESTKTAEVAAVLDGIHGFETSAVVLARVSDFAKSDEPELVAAATRAVARMDALLETARSETIIRWALGSDLPAEQLAALDALDIVGRVPQGWIEPALRLAVDPTTPVGRRAIKVLGNLGRLHADGQHLVAPLLAQVTRSGRSNPAAQGAILASLGELAPSHAVVRERLRQAFAREIPFQVTQGAARGMYFIEDPTREEYLALCGRSLEGSLISLCIHAMDKPSWEEARKRYGIKHRFER